jgi:uncharacterized membrane protein YdjX (TVP38/TMEM64 family)
MEEGKQQSEETEKEPFFQRIWQGTKKLVNQLWEMTKRAFRDHSRTTWIWIGIFIVVIAATVALYVIQIYDPDLLFRIIVTYVVKPIYEIGFWGHLIFFLIMGIQAILLPIPSEAVLLSAGMIWGWWGLIDGIIGSMLAGIITYFMVAKGGRPLAEKFTGPEAIEILDRFIDKYGAWAIIILRAFPFMAFDPVSFAAGLTKIKTKTYLLATFVGSIVRVIFYIALGDFFLPGGNIQDYIDDPVAMEQTIKDNSKIFNIMSLVIVLLGVGFLALYQFWLMPYLQKKGEKEKNSKMVIVTKEKKESKEIEHKPKPDTNS